MRREASSLAAAGHDVVDPRVGAGHRPDGRTRDGYRRRSVLPPAALSADCSRFTSTEAAFLVWFVRGIVAVRPDVVHAHDAAMLLPARLRRALGRGRARL